MQLQNMKQLEQLVCMLEAFLDDRYTMRTSKALASHGEMSVPEAEGWAASLGLARKRRLRDGATLWVKPADTRDEEDNDSNCGEQPCAEALRSALRDSRWRARSFRALMQATGLNEQAIRAQLPSIGARVTSAGFVTLQ